MGHDISVKSTGFMIDELISTCLKARHFAVEGGCSAKLAEDLKQRKQALREAIDSRLGDAAQASSSIGELIAELADALIECWNAQEGVMSGGDDQAVALAAKAAQHLNAERNRLVREIDNRLGEGAITVTGKTYG